MIFLIDANYGALTPISIILQWFRCVERLFFFFLIIKYFLIGKEITRYLIRDDLNNDSIDEKFEKTIKKFNGDLNGKDESDEIHHDASWWWALARIDQPWRENL